MLDKINKDLADLFESGNNLLEKGSSTLVNSFRQAAFDEFQKAGGVPHKKENYKYTPLLPIFNRDYHVTLKKVECDAAISEEFNCNVTDLSTRCYVLINGRWYDESNAETPKLEKVIVCGFDEASRKYPEIFSQYYNQISTEPSADPLIALNTAFVQDGLFVYIPSGVVLEESLQLVNLLKAETDFMCYQRNLIVLGKNAQANLLVCDHVLSDNKFLYNNTTEIYLEEGANLDFNQVQNQHLGASQINSIIVKQKRDSVYNANVISLYGGLIRNNIYANLTQSGADCNLYGLYITDGKQVVDNFTQVDHSAPNCTSRELFKGILTDNSLANFCGSIYVRPDAQKTEAYQSNNNLLLSDDARLNTKPQLVIDADDVKCSHGATVGQIDEEAMFYLRSRGIGPDEARQLMMFGFAHDIIQHIKLEALRNKIDKLIENRLRGKMNNCSHCKLDCSSVV